MIDGYRSFAEGMDQSSEPNLIGPASYASGVNVYVPFYSDRLKTRPGIHHVTMEFEGDREALEIYRNGHIQGSGSYRANGRDYHIKVVDGFVYEFVENRRGVLKGRRKNIGFPNNSNRTKAWVTTVPGGAIINDGESLPIYVTPTNARQSCPDEFEIGVGRMGVYVQNRFFYVNEHSDFIYVSDYGDPMSLSSAYSNNVFGFAQPDADDRITAIGLQKALSRDVFGGELVFSTENNVYSADVRGGLDDWGVNGLGVARLVLAGVGATSQYSFESFNTNLWFRTKDGMVGFRQIQDQFASEDAILNNSVEVQKTLDQDTRWMLDQCHSVRWKNRLITTISPSLHDGYVYWNGMLVMSPSPRITGGKRVAKRFDGIWTGVHPWCLTVLGEKLFIDSKDQDGINRCYLLDDEHDYDMTSSGIPKEIEGHVETRSFDFEESFIPKIVDTRQVSFFNMNRSVDLRFLTREDGTGPWREFDRRSFLIKGRCDDGEIADMQPYQTQDRRAVQLPSEGFRDTPAIGDANGRNIYHRQYRIEFKGNLEIGGVLLQAREQTIEESVTPDEETETGLVYEEPGDYTYEIQNA